MFVVLSSEFRDFDSKQYLQLLYYLGRATQVSLGVSEHGNSIVEETPHKHQNEGNYLSHVAKVSCQDLLMGSERFRKFCLFCQYNAMSVPVLKSENTASDQADVGKRGKHSLVLEPPSSDLG